MPSPIPPFPSGTITLDPASPLIAQNVRIRRGLEGPQIVLEWDAPKTIPLGAYIRVVRLLYEFSTNPYIGEVVFEGPAAAGFVADLNVEACKCYYYTIFTWTPDFVFTFSPSTQASELAIQTGFFANLLFNLLPNIYVLGDKLLDQDKNAQADAVFALQPTFDPVNHEWFNIHENTDPSVAPKKRGPLNRFMKGIAVEFDIVKGLIDCFSTLWDVDNTCCGNLPALGSILALDVNQEFSCSRQRAEIKEQVAILKVKGTKTAVKARGTLITGLETEIQEWCGNILISNRLDRTSLKFPNNGFGLRYKLPGDDTSYTPGGEIGFNTFTVFFMLLCDSCVPDTVVHKINRVMRPEFPVCRVGFFAFVDCTFVEFYDESRLADSNYDEIDDSEAADTEYVDREHWLYSNRLDDTVNPGRSGPLLTLSNSRNLSNSLRAVSATPAPALEMWWDQIIIPARINMGHTNVSRINDGAGFVLPPCPGPGRTDEGRTDCARIDEG